MLGLGGKTVSEEGSTSNEAFKSTLPLKPYSSWEGITTWFISNLPGWVTISEYESRQGSVNHTMLKTFGNTCNVCKGQHAAGIRIFPR